MTDAEILELLRSLEWSGTDNCDYDRCPLCIGYPPDTRSHAEWNEGRIGHASDCKLAAAIQALEKRVSFDVRPLPFTIGDMVFQGVWVDVTGPTEAVIPESEEWRGNNEQSTCG